MPEPSDFEAADWIARAEFDAMRAAESPPVFTRYQSPVVLHTTSDGEWITRAEFDALTARVAALELLLACDGK